ncbi:MAG: hypothetical protein HY707_08965 [Ignavibacteriae bacterium]|nr:hypothetical protein [Ignavibacteriota bacterium]
MLNAEGMGQAMVAEMNGYPGPKHVLELAKELNLTDQQKKSVREAYEEMRARARELGKRIIDIEQEMNDAFRNGLVSAKSLSDDAEQIGRLRGRLRGVHLVAHLRTKDILTTKQLELYKKLRKTESEGKR